MDSLVPRNAKPHMSDPGNIRAHEAQNRFRHNEHKADESYMRSSKSRSRNKNNRNRNQNSGANVINRVFDSSGPEGKVRGTPQQIIDKYNQLARDAQLSNDRVAAENFQQHAEHYLRLLAEATKEQEKQRLEQEARREEQERQNRERQAERDRERAERQEREAQQQPQAQPQQDTSDQPDVVDPTEDSGLVETPESKPRRAPRRKPKPKPVASEDASSGESPEAAE